MNQLRLLLLFCGSLLLPACELVARFDPSELDQNRTIGPMPLPTLDGAVPLLPDGSLRFDGALVRDDTGVGRDAATPSDAAVSDASDAHAPDADLSAPDASDAPDADAGDAGQLDDGGDAAAIQDAGPQDAMAPDLFADV